MESTKNRKKGLLSIVALIVCLAMLTVGTYAWFTDTATVSGNQVMAGNLDVAIVMTGEEIMSKDTNAVLPATVEEGQSITYTSGTGNFVGAKLVKVVKDGATASPEKSWYDVTGLNANKIRLGNLEPGAVYPVVLDVYNRGDLAIGFTAAFNLPKRGGDGIYKNELASYTGLEALSLQKNGKLGEFEAESTDSTHGYFGTGHFEYTEPSTSLLTNDEFLRRADKLAKKMLSDTDYQTVTKTADSWNDFITKLGSYTNDVKTMDKGGKIQDVLEIYAVSMDEYGDYYSETDGWITDTSKDFTEKTPAKRRKTDNKLVEPEKMNAHLLGTVEEFLHINDSDDDFADYVELIKEERDVAKQKLQNKEDELRVSYEIPEGGDMTKVYTDLTYLKYEKEYWKLVEKVARVENLKDKLAQASSGYCVPTKALGSSDSIEVQLYDTEDESGDPVWHPGEVKDLGKAVFLIKMSEDADDLYQNAYIELDMGVTANQVKWDRDGVNNYLYDPNPENSNGDLQSPVSNPDPELETEPTTESPAP